jgi:hypothetical protein
LKRLAALLLAWFFASAADLAPFRPPAVPLIVHDPYFSIWSDADHLNADITRHWTGTPQEISSLIRVDGKVYRIMGAEKSAEPLPQTSVEVLPTRTIYAFAGAGVEIGLTFLTPALPKDLDILSRPATYVVWQVRSTDGRQHEASLYFDAAANLVVDNRNQKVQVSRFQMDGAPVLRIGSLEQQVLAKSGDNLRIDWGYLYITAPAQNGLLSATVDRRDALNAFADSGRVPENDNFNGSALAMSFDLGSVGGTAVSRHLVIAYDDLYSIELLQRRLRPYWRRNGATPEDLLRAALHDYDSLSERSRKFDDELMADLRKSGGEEYARLASLAYRQAVGAHKLAADVDGSPLLFPKENFSNGCISTVDVIYPSAPLFLLLSPELARAQMKPVMDYARLPRWRWPFAPHDLGTYPLANGQVYGGGEKTETNQMPVEESGNMLILILALAQAEGNTSFAQQYWPELTKWAEYLKEKGLDPENQLSTDDFAGHLAHNANLSIKAIVALGSYAKLAEMLGKKQEAAAYRAVAEDFAKRFGPMAKDGDHYRLAFDKPGTWSQKYNLVWDKILGLNLFSPEISRTEMAFYKAHQQVYGLPLDNRKLYTKLDWVIWTATLAENDSDFRAIASPAYRFANGSPGRVPLSDWYWTQDSKQLNFQARSVVGGVFIKLLADHRKVP